MAILLVALFAAAAIGSAFVLADCAVRGRNAFRRLRGEAEGDRAVRPVSVRFEDFAPLPALPAIRAQRGLSASRRARPKAAWQAQTLPAAA